MSINEYSPATSTSPVYDRLAAGYDRVMRPLERLGLARLRAALLRELPPDSRLLEIGAGTGANFPHYPHGASGAASELSLEMIKRARDRERPPRVQLVQASAVELPFADDSFDAAVATLVFCSVASPSQVFAELRRVVRQGGAVLLLEHVRPDNLLGPFFDALNLITVPLFEDHFNRRIADQARRAGLRFMRVERHAFGILQLIRCEV